MDSKIQGSTILITGANGGIGKETVKQLLAEKPKVVLLGCRKQGVADNLALELRDIAGSTKLIALGGFDMNDPKSIESSAQKIPEGVQLDVIFLQAGGVVFKDNFEFTEYNGTQFEKTVFQNALGSYATLLALKNNSRIGEKVRIIFAGGEGARGIKGMIDSPDFESGEELMNYIHSGNKEKYNPMNAIGVSKLVSALLVDKLAELDPSNEYVWFSPGLTAGTNGLDKLGGFKKFMMKHVVFNIMKLFGAAQNAKNAAKKNVDALSGRIGHSGDIIGAPEGKALGKLVDQKPMNSLFTNHHQRDMLWKVVSKQFGDFTHIQS